MADPFSGHNPGLDCPARGGVNITLADSDLSQPVRAIRCKTGGTMKVTGVDGTTWNAFFTDGETRALHVKRCWLTGSTGVADIEGLY